MLTASSWRLLEMNDVRRILATIEPGDSGASEQHLPLVGRFANADINTLDAHQTRENVGGLCHTFERLSSSCSFTTAGLPSLTSPRSSASFAKPPPVGLRLSRPRQTVRSDSAAIGLSDDNERVGVPTDENSGSFAVGS
jgi:hypothetical protein